MSARRRRRPPPDALDARIEEAVRRAWERIMARRGPREFSPMWYSARFLEQAMQAEVARLDRGPRWRR
jgi:hypothetical protein